MTMLTKIQFQKGASVLTADGAQVGTVERVVVNPSTSALTDIVVRTGGLLKSDEKVVPIGMIAETSEDLILLREEAGELESLPPFEEERLVDAHGTNNHTAEQHPVIVGFPVLGTPVVRASIDEKPVTRIEQNIPEGTVAVKEGAKVLTAEGKHVGNVESVLADPAAEEVTHLLISKGLLSKATKLIPQGWIRSWGEEQVHLRVKRETVEELKDASLAV
jgi:uncharacterized protein YrrD